MRPSPRAWGGRAEGLLWLVVTAFGWGFNWPVVKSALAVWHPFTFRLLSSAAAMALLLGLAASAGQAVWPRGRREWGLLALFAVFNVTSFVGLSTFSLLWLDASEAAIIAYTMPIWAALLAWPLLGERPNRWRLGGLALGVAGVVVLLAPLVLARGGNFTARLPGFAAIFATAWLFACGAVLGKRLKLHSAPLPAAAWQIGLGTLPLLPISLAFEPWTLGAIPASGWFDFAYVAVIALGLAYLAWFRALELLPAATAAIGTLMVPVVGVLSAGAILGEGVGARQGVALALTLSGVALAMRGR